MSPITIYHNPKCGTSRNVLALIRNAGIEPTVIEYLKTPPSRAELVALIAATGAPVLLNGGAGKSGRLPGGPCAAVPAAGVLHCRAPWPR
jgi:hypothetical protein